MICWFNYDYGRLLLTDLRVQAVYYHGMIVYVWTPSIKYDYEPFSVGVGLPSMLYRRNLEVIAVIWIQYVFVTGPFDHKHFLWNEHLLNRKLMWHVVCVSGSCSRLCAQLWYTRAAWRTSIVWKTCFVWFPSKYGRLLVRMEVKQKHAFGLFVWCGVFACFE